ncbi:MAG: protein translocase subunit SecD [Hyphomicrobiales bacterium]|nr:protein translocase subunit SecD [Hyphomicrobiales bacterium]MDE2017593.1 protein translocase subunit SecD [Hyphomicrobiales bacterium]
MLRFSRPTFVGILIVAFLAALSLVPSFLPAPTVAALQARLWFLPVRAIPLGLDLQGGAHVLLQVDSASVAKNQVSNLRDDARRVLRENKIPVVGGIGETKQGAIVHLLHPEDSARAVAALSKLSQPIGFGVGGNGGVSMTVADSGGGVLRLEVTQAQVAAETARAVDQSIEVLRRRLDPVGNRELSIQREGIDRVALDIPGLQDTSTIVPLLKTANLEFRFVAQPGAAPSGFDVLKMQPQTPGGAAGVINVEKQVIVRGADLTDASPGFDSQTNEPVVNFTFNIQGGQAFAQATAANIGRPFAIVLDGEVISAPVIRSAITGGRGQISGNFTVAEATDLATLLKAGALPAKLAIVQEQTVGPGLGQDSIAAGKLAAYVGGVLVVAYMLATYGIFGVFADIALAIHILFIFASMALIGATLTLPGIAGVVFTIGMAVDSNVLIYERIREEAHAGRPIASALDAGFKRAFATIVDSNVTMFVAAAILFFFGTGPVKGFAVSLGLGILTSVITAVTMTRMMIALWHRRTRAKTLPI